jgi:hypothetical protein
MTPATKAPLGSRRPRAIRSFHMRLIPRIILPQGGLPVRAS